MKFKFNKFKAFTLSELMIMLSVLTVLLAAFAPVFTVRYNNASSSEIWNEVPDDEERDVYTDQTNKVVAAQSFIGITPSSSTDVLKAIKDENNHMLYSKVVIRPTESLTGTSDTVQKQIQFRYDGTPVGALFAGNKNMLLGGNYEDIETSATGNSAYGVGALSSLKDGVGNTALGYNALRALSSANYNTAIGYSAGYGGRIVNSGSLFPSLTGRRPLPKIQTGATGNTLVGYNSFTGSSSNYTTVIGKTTPRANTAYNRSSFSTVVGNGSARRIGRDNVVVGDHSLDFTTSSAVGNTVLGSRALTSENVGSYNTAVGYGACSGVTGSYKTCIGYNSGSVAYGSNNSFLLSDSRERVYIGGPVYQDGPSALGGVSVLEVHNVPSTGSYNPLNNTLGDSSVLINGNLIVRGQTFMTVNNRLRDYHKNSLVGFRVLQPKAGRRTIVFSGWDGQERNFELSSGCRGCRRHVYSNGRTNCTCVQESITSYDWSTKGDGNTGNGCMTDKGASYTDAHTGTKYEGKDYDRNEAHRTDGKTCCPVLLSDKRLKNVGDKFSAGLNEIKRLNIYNYTYKSDDTKTPHVGVIAQDLKRVFPTAVSKDENGYYQIRWDEMFYAAINAVKTLNTKVECLANRVVTDQKRIAALKKDNANLEKKLNSLSAELTELEKKH